MDSHEFVKLAKQEAVDSSLSIIMNNLKSPRAPRPIASGHPAGSPSEWIDTWFNQGAIKEQRQAAWFASLNADDQATFMSLLEECAELSGLGFFTLIDGAGGDCDGVFEIVHVSADGRRTVLNPQNTEMLHDVFSEICEEDRRRDG